jgi:ferric-dicitrate binding protein FerR (iron transport regulator)
LIKDRPVVHGRGSKRQMNGLCIKGKDVMIQAPEHKAAPSPKPHRRQALWRRLSVAVVLALFTAAGAWWLTHRQPATELARDAATQVPEERALREASAQSPRDADAQRALGSTS